MTSFLRRTTAPGQSKDHEKRVGILERKHAGGSDHDLADHRDTSKLRTDAAGVWVPTFSPATGWTLQTPGGGGGGEYAIAAILNYPPNGYPPFGYYLCPMSIAVNTGPFVIGPSGNGLQYTGASAQWVDVEATFHFAPSLGSTHVLEVYTLSSGAYIRDVREFPGTASEIEVPTMHVAGRFLLPPNEVVQAHVYQNDTVPSDIGFAGNNADQVGLGFFMSLTLL